MAILSEELGEVLQVLGKIQRHGFDSRHPKFWDSPPLRGETNRADLEREIADVFAAVDRMVAVGDIDMEMILNHKWVKSQRKQYLHHNES